MKEIGHSTSLMTLARNGVILKTLSRLNLFGEKEQDTFDLRNIPHTRTDTHHTISLQSAQSKDGSSTPSHQRRIPSHWSRTCGARTMCHLL